ncbi:hypothetical protein PYCCODRAFT_1468915 [Trametes coccinea BRFM310]|uniref:Uncharacterized protein n=1 Tax=Trametes coccinea (strain BRFM310) TaxID=1353009 RepID=A0A1Y2IIG5_TRAC3|nr:hypothetical protein PYCCODRAFT_1468915 [Trametes coccinea BRFM310]
MVATRASNSEIRPGMVDVPKTRRTTEQVNAAKAAKAAGDKKAKKQQQQREEDLAEMELDMEEKERTIRRLRDKHSGDSTAKRKRRNSASSDEEGKKATRKKSKVVVEESGSEDPASAREDDDPPTGSEYDGNGVSSELSELSDPKRKRKAKGEPLRRAVEAAKTRLARSDVGEEDAASVAPSISTATDIVTPRSRISAWAAGMKSAGLSASSTSTASTPIASKSRPAANTSRTAAIPATPFAPVAGTKAKSKAPVVPDEDSDTDAPKQRGKKKEDKKKEDKKKENKKKGRVIPRPKERIKEEPVSDRELGNAGYVGSEDEAAEAAAAQASPKKNGTRLTSTTIVNVRDVDIATPGRRKTDQAKKAAASSRSSESSASKSQKTASTNSGTGSNDKPICLELDDEDDGSVKVVSGGKSRTARRNSSLPDGAQDNNLWKGVFLPTLLKALGTRDDPWSVTDKDMVATLQSIWNATYGSRLHHTVKVNDGVHSLATQRIYEWRSAIGSAALQSFDSFFSSSPDDFPDAQSRSAFCSSIRGGGRLFFKEPEGDSKRGLYRSPFVIAGLAVHVNAIRGAIHVPGMYADPLDEHPYGAIGLAAAAAYRVCNLWHDGKMTYNANGVSSIIKVKNQSSGRARTKSTEFSSANYSGTTAQCARSARKMPQGSLARVIEDAYARARLPGPAHRVGNDPADEFNFEDLAEEE